MAGNDLSHWIARLNATGAALGPAALAGLVFSVLWLLGTAAIARRARSYSSASENLAWRLALVGTAIAFLAPALRDAARLPVRPVAARVLPAPPAPGSWAGLRHSYTPRPDPRPAQGRALPDGGPSVTNAVAAPRLPLRLPGVLFACWIAVAGYRLVVLTREAWRWACIRRDAHSAESAVQSLAAETARCFGCGRAVPVLESLEAPAPMAQGLLRPAILLPAPVDDLQQIRPVLAHELAHLARGDLWVLHLLRFTQAFLFFHPLLPLVGRRLQASAEAACDDWVVRRLGDPAGYARALLSWAERTVPATALASPFPGAVGLRWRVDLVLDGSRRRLLRASRVTVAACVAGIALLSCASACVRLARRQAPPPVLVPPPSCQPPDGSRFVLDVSQRARTYHKDSNPPGWPPAGYPARLGVTHMDRNGRPIHDLDGLTAIAYDSHGCPFFAGLGQVMFSGGYPKRDRTFRLCFFHKGAAAGEATITNPTTGPFPEWKPEPLPITRHAGSLDFTLERLDISPHEEYGLPYGFAGWARFRVEEHGVVTRSWEPELRLEDATGNGDPPGLWGNAGRYRGPGEPPLYFWLSVPCVREPAWKIRARFSRNALAHFDADEMLRVSGIPSPGRGIIVPVNRTAKVQGYTLRLLAVAGPGVYDCVADPSSGVMPRRASRTPKRPFDPPGSHVFVTLSPYDHRSMPLRVRGSDDRGKTFHSTDWASGYRTHAERLYNLIDFRVEIPRGSRTLDLTLAVADKKVHTVEYVVKPPRLGQAPATLGFGGR